MIEYAIEVKTPTAAIRLCDYQTYEQYSESNRNQPYRTVYHGKTWRRLDESERLESYYKQRVKHDQQVAKIFKAFMRQSSNGYRRVRKGV